MDGSSYVPNYELRERFKKTYRTRMSALQGAKTEADMQVHYYNLAFLIHFLGQCEILSFEEFEEYMKPLERAHQDWHINRSEHTPR